MSSRLLKTVLIGGMALGLTVQASACTCDIWKPAKKLRKARAVFVGEVVEIGSNPTDDWASVLITFRVERYWKGVKRAEISAVSMPAAGCGLPVKRGGKYLIYAFLSQRKQLEVDACSSASMEGPIAREELKFLGKGKTPKNRNKERVEGMTASTADVARLSDQRNRPRECHPMAR